MRAKFGQSVAIMGLFVSLVVGAIIMWMFEPVYTDMLTRAAGTTTTQAGSDANTYLTTFGAYLPVVFVLLASLGLVVKTARQRSGLQ